MKLFTISQFNYCPIAWICHSRSFYNKDNHIHESAFRIVCQDLQLSFSALLVNDNFYHPKKISTIISNRTFKIKMNIYPGIMNIIFFYFSKNFTNEPRYGNCLSISNINSMHFGIDPIPYIAAQIWSKTFLMKSKKQGPLQFLKTN